MDCKPDCESLLHGGAERDLVSWRDVGGPGVWGGEAAGAAFYGDCGVGVGWVGFGAEEVGRGEGEGGVSGGGVVRLGGVGGGSVRVGPFMGRYGGGLMDG